MFNFRELQDIVIDEISKLQIPARPPELYKPIKYSVNVGGKRLRPVLVLAACNLFSDEIEPAIAPALAIEVFHNFTLLHDDLMDNADLRRNQPTVHKKWNDNIAILSGDAMMIKAYQLIVKVPQEHLSSVIELFSQTAIEVCEGQQYDMNFEQRNDVAENEYIEMIRLKTSVLVAASLKIGALCADASKDEAQKLYNFGINLGLAFQLKDDFLDVYGDPETFGKKIGGDIVANKKTYMVIKAKELAKGEDSMQLNKLFSRHDMYPDEKISSVIEIFNRLNIRQIVKDKMTYYYNMAIDSLHSVNVPQEKKAILIDLADKLMVRES